MRISNEEFMKGLEKPNRDSETTQILEIWKVTTTPKTRRSVGWNGVIRAPKLGPSSGRCPEGERGLTDRRWLPSETSPEKHGGREGKREGGRERGRKKGGGKGRLKGGMHRHTERNTPASLLFPALDLPLVPPFSWTYPEASWWGSLRNVGPCNREQRGRRQRMTTCKQASDPQEYLTPAK